MKSKNELLDMADSLKYAELFEELDNLGANNATFFALRREYIHQGANPEYNDRVKAFIIDFFAQKPASPTSWFKNKIVRASLLLISISLLLSLWYFNFRNNHLQDCQALLLFLEKNAVFVQVIQKIEGQEIKLIPHKSTKDTLFYQTSDSTLIKFYFERCLNEKTTLGKFIRFSSQEQQIIDIRVEALQDDFKTLAITEKQGANTQEHYFEIDDHFNISAYEKKEEKIKGHYTEDLTPVQNKKTKKWGFVDRTGKIVVDYQFDTVAYFIEDLALVKLNDKYGFIDKKGKTVIDHQFEEAGYFFDGLARVRLNNRYGFIDKTGKMVIDCRFDEVSVFHENLAVVKLNNKYGFIDKTGKIVIACQFDRAGYFVEGLAKVELNEKEFYINTKGNIAK